MEAAVIWTAACATGRCVYGDAGSVRIAPAATRNQAETSSVTPVATDDSANLYAFMVLTPLVWLRSLAPSTRYRRDAVAVARWNMDRSLSGRPGHRKAKATKCGKGGAKRVERPRPVHGPDGLPIAACPSGVADSRKSRPFMGLRCNGAERVPAARRKPLKNTRKRGG